MPITRTYRKPALSEVSLAPPSPTHMANPVSPSPTESPPLPETYMQTAPMSEITQGRSEALSHQHLLVMGLFIDSSETEFSISRAKQSDYEYTRGGQGALIFKLPLAQPTPEADHLLIFVAAASSSDNPGNIGDSTASEASTASSDVANATDASAVPATVSGIMQQDAETS